MNPKKRAISFADNFNVAPELALNETDLVHQKMVATPDEHMSKLGLQAISIRLQPDLIQDLKTIAQHNGIGYQTLIKQILHRFVHAEMKMLANEKQKELRLQALEEELQLLKAIQQEMEAQHQLIEWEKNKIQKAA